MFEAPYDVLMVIWGVLFVLIWIGFILVMNQIFQREEREAEARDLVSDVSANSGQHHPLHPAA